MARKEKSHPARLDVKLPKGYKIVVGDNFAKTFRFDKAGQCLEGTVLNTKQVKYKGKKLRVMTLENGKGVVAVWESVQLAPLFDSAKKGDEVYIRFDGTSKVKGYKNEMRLFTTAIKE